MKFYQYIGENKYNRPCKESIRAEDEADAKRRLQAEGKTVDWIEEDRDANARMKPDTIRHLSSGRVQKTSWYDVLGYAMPIGGAVIALIGLLIGVQMMKPPVPDVTPEQVIKQFIALDRQSSYGKQYALLTKERQVFFKSAQKYAKQKRRWRRGADGATVQFGKITAINEKSSGIRKAEYRVTAFRKTGLTYVDFLLQLKRGEWKINRFRDPQIIERYIGTLLEMPDEDMKRKYVWDLKGITGYSDLKIEGLKKNFSMDKRISKDLI